MKIGICLDNKEISRDIARRAAELYKGTDIYILDAESDNHNTEDFDVFLDEKIDLKSPVSLILREKIFEYEEKTGAAVGKPERYETDVIFIDSQFGGSGVSAVSTALGRLFAGREDRKVLLVEKGKIARMHYLEPEYKPARSQRELEFLIEKNLKTCFSRYYLRDKYGPFFIAYSGLSSDILKLNDENKEFGLIIFAGFDEEQKLDGANYIEIVNRTDRRHDLSGETDKNIRVINRAEANIIEGNTVRIVNDDFSFTVDGESVLIKMDGSFLSGVDLLYEKIRELI